MVVTSASSTTERKKVIVIGAGIGGLGAAGRLAREGFDVIVVEKNDHAGGRCDQINWKGFKFDIGPSIVLVPSAYEDTYNALGESITDHLDMRRIDPSYGVHFSDGDSINLTANTVAMQNQLERIEPGSYLNFLKLLAEGRVNMHGVLRGVAYRNFRSLLEYFDIRQIPLLFQVKAPFFHHWNISRYFKNPKLRAAFTFQDMYVGLSPFNAPATFSLLQYTEFCDGVWYPMGGLYQVILTLEKIVREKLHVPIRYSSPVAKIDIDEKTQKATGVVLQNGEKLEADVVVANANLPYVYCRLLPDQHEADRLDKMSYTSSSITFCWSLKKEYKQLGHHNMFVASEAYRESFDQIFNDLTLPDAPSFYVNVPNRTDSSMAPAGQDAWVVLVPVGHLAQGDWGDESKQGRHKIEQNWDEMIKRAREVVIKRLSQPDIGITDLKDNLLHEEIVAPQDWADRYNTWKGTAFGLSHNFLQVGYLRPHNRHDTYSNLYFTGCSTHPGSGLPNVLMSSRLTTERVLEDLGQRPTDDLQTRGLLSGKFPAVPHLWEDDAGVKLDENGNRIRLKDRYRRIREEERGNTDLYIMLSVACGTMILAIVLSNMTVHNSELGP
eukprot:Clim_evm7s198 gene=Clim_evmTU7s198